MIFACFDFGRCCVLGRYSCWIYKFFILELVFKLNRKGLYMRIQFNVLILGVGEYWGVLWDDYSMKKMILERVFSWSYYISQYFSIFFECCKNSFTIFSNLNFCWSQRMVLQMLGILLPAPDIYLTNKQSNSEIIICQLFSDDTIKSSYVAYTQCLLGAITKRMGHENGKRKTK